ncbi:hypothetical protein GT347_22035 [Xylophilus rhododendri]|uniref:Exo-alpha-sialidase n=1 Tax=Xylophilus rhododendri TaxID=2697032 RepID=A0A857J8P8_9BURK|nr:sialidase family protein [Xylophilus rhododendri]QHJ00421.1 hypothetical protein GT347_22035 [Xylophilus rhododendri]
MQRLTTGQSTFGLVAEPDGALYARMAIVGPSTIVSHDGGKTWKHTGESPGLTGPRAVDAMAVDRRDGALLAFLPDNAIMRSPDEGATWRIVKDLR